MKLLHFMQALEIWILATLTFDLEPCHYFDPTPPMLEISTHHATKRCVVELISVRKGCVRSVIYVRSKWELQ